jgi:hypothetical protein
LACGRATAQIGPENSAGCGSGSMFESECHALLRSISERSIVGEYIYSAMATPAITEYCSYLEVVTFSQLF